MDATKQESHNSEATASDEAPSEIEKQSESSMQSGSGQQALDDLRALTSSAKDSEKTHVENGNLPVLSIDGAEPKSKWQGSKKGNEIFEPIEKAPAAERELSAEQRYFASFYQKERLLKFLTLITSRTESGNPEKRLGEEEWQQKVDVREAAIREEMTKGQWGPASQSAMKDYLALMQEKTLPILVRQLESAGKSIPPGSPLEVPVENGQRISNQEYISRIISGKLQVDLKINTAEPPGLAEARRIEDAAEWMNKTAEIVHQAELQRRDEQITQLIKDRKLPEGWLYKEGQDKDAWRAAATAMLERTMRVGRNIGIVDKLQLPIELPAGTKLSKDKDGNVNISMDLPKTLSLDDPANLEKIRRLQEWDKESKPKIASAIKQLEASRENPISAISWADATIPKVKDPLTGKEVNSVAILDKDNKLIEIGDPSKIKLKDGQTTQPINLLEQRPKIEIAANGDVTVTMQVQAQKVPWYGYQNMIYDNVGNPADLKSQTFKPDDLVAVQNGSQTEFMLAKDLQRYAELQATMHYGIKTLMITMDVAMLAFGAVQVAAAVEGAIALATATATNLTAKQVAWYAAKGIFDAGLGLTGPLANAYWMSSETGRTANVVRGGLFVASALPGAYGVIKDIGTGSKWLLGIKSAEDLSGLMAAEQEARAFQQLIQKAGAGFATTADWSGKVMNYLQVPMGPMVAHGLMTEVKEFLYPTDPYAAYKSVLAFESAPKEADVAAPGMPTPNIKPDEMPDALKRIKGYSDVLTENLPNDKNGKKTAEQIKQLFEKLARAIAPDAKPELREALKKELAANIAFKSYDVQYFEVAFQGKLSSAQLNDLMDPEKRKGYPIGVKERVEQVLRLRNQDLVTASQIALLYLSRQTGSKIPGELIALDHKIPADVVPGPKGRQGVPAHAVSISLDSNLIAADLRRRLENASANSRGIAIADVLVKTNELTPSQFAGILQNILNTPAASAREKMRALSDASGPRLIAAIAGTYFQEALQAADTSLTDAQRNALAARNFGISSADLERTLKSSAANDADPNVRAMSAAILYGLRILKKSPDDGLKFLNKLTSLRENEFDKNKGNFPANALNVMMSELAAARPTDIQRRLDAFESLSLLSNKMLTADAKKVQEQIAKSIGESLINASLRDANLLLNTLNKEIFAVLVKDNPQLASAITYTAILYLKTPPAKFDAQQEQQLVQLMRKVPVLLAGADEIAQKLFANHMKNILERSDKSYFDLRAATIESISSLGDSSSKILLPTLRNTAGTDAYAKVRLSALSVLEQLKDPELQLMLPALAAKESDPSVARVLGDLQYKLGTNNSDSTDSNAPKAELAAFEAGISERYPKLADFNNEAQGNWLLKNFPLLVRARFRSEIVRATDGKQNNHWFNTATSAGDKVVAQREEQFKALIDLAKGDASSDTAQQARKVLASIIANEKIVDDQNHKIPIGDMLVQVPEGMPRFIPIFYQEKAVDWATRAADALIETASTANNGRDLSARLIAGALASGIQGPARNSLLKAWDSLNKKENGSRMVSESLYDYLVS